MKKIIIIIINIISFQTYSQIDANSVFVLPEATNAEMIAITGMQIGSTLYNTTDSSVYVFNGSAWVRTTDGIDAGDVSLITNVDVDGDGAIETTVEEVVEDITNITSTAARIFYPPSIAIDASSTGTFSVNLYTDYFNQYSSPVAASDVTAPSIPTYLANELYYYVTYADPAVFDLTLPVGDPGEFTISATGVLNYTIQSVPATANTLINVVFVVK